MRTLESKTSLRNSFLLFVGALIWGMAFVAQGKGSEYMQAFTFHGTRCLIGALTMAVYLMAAGYFDKRHRLSRERWLKNLKAGLVCGIFFTL